MEEEHADDAVAGLVQLEEVDNGVLCSCDVNRAHMSNIQRHTTDAAKEPFSQRRR